MSELRTDRLTPVHAQTVRLSPDDRGRQHREHQEQPRHELATAGAEELAVALADSASGALTARYEEDSAGVPRIRVLEVATGSTVAVVTPEELRVLAERTGLPTGLLLRTTT